MAGEFRVLQEFAKLGETSVDELLVVLARPGAHQRETSIATR